MESSSLHSGRTHIRLTASQVAKFQEALADAFRTKNSLKAMVRVVLNKNLESIAGGDNLSDIAFNLIDWAEATGHIEQLIQGAYWHQPGNQKLNDFYDRYINWLSTDSRQEAECPYRALQSFNVEHARFFFGRDRMVDRLLQKLKANSSPIVSLVGPSGSGKSSLVQAGLIHRVKQDGFDWKTTVFTPGPLPIHRLAATLIDWLDPELRELQRFRDIEEIANNFRLANESRYLIWSRLLEMYDNQLFLFVVDQFEELYTLGADVETIQYFIDNLLYATEVSESIRFVFALRADFYSHLFSHPVLAATVDQGLVNVVPLDEDELAEVILEPVRHVHPTRSFEEGLPERILEDVVGEPGGLPLLEFALTELWYRQTSNGVLTHEAYKDIGGVVGAIAKRAEHEFELFERKGQGMIVRSVFTRLVRPGVDTKDTRLRATWEDLEGINTEWDNLLVREVIHSLAKSRLIVTGRDPVTGATNIEVAHEALIRHWIRLQKWIDEDREFLTWRQVRFVPRLREWIESSQHDDALLSGLTLVETKRWIAEGRIGDFNENEQAYIFHSILNDDRANLHEWLPRFGSPGEVSALIASNYITSEAPVRRRRGASAFQYMPKTDATGEIDATLTQMVLEDDAEVVRREATHSLAIRGEISRLTLLLDSQSLSGEEENRVIRALRFARNIPRLGVRVRETLRRKRLRVLLAANWQLLLNYRIEIGITLVLAYVLGLVTSQVLFVFARFFPYESGLSSSFGMIVLLALGVYSFIRKQIVDGQSLTFVNAFEIGLASIVIGFFGDLLEVVLDFGISTEVLLARSASVWISSSTMILALKVKPASRWSTLKLAAVVLLSSAIYVYLDPFTIGQLDPLEWTLLILFRAVWIFPFIFGLHLGLRSAFGDELDKPVTVAERPSLEEEMTAYPQRKSVPLRERLRVSYRALGLTMVVIVVMASVVWIFLPPSLVPSKCSLTPPGEFTAVVINGPTLMRSDPNLAPFVSSGHEVSRNECVTVIARSANEKWVYVRLSDNRVGWLERYTLTMPREADISELPLLMAE